MLHDKTFDFSFSGLKTAARNVVASRTLTDELKKQVSREFEECVADVLTAKTLRAVEEYSARTVVVGGGVSANMYIRERLADALAQADASAEILTPSPELATDNALKRDFADPVTLVAKGNLRL
jgi:N6-L-threonylcarbamoyladenine synthase